ncbi:MAG: hypothetical protein M3P32_06860 [Chloroflexota bacterium]|nr:hypothetical protein [Chloroflexota bacterium]
MQTDLRGLAGVVAPFSGPRALAWGLLSLIGFVLSSMSLLFPISAIESAFGMPHAAALGMWAFAWSIAGGLLVLACGRLVFNSWLEVGVGAWLILLCGALVSAVHLGVLAQWMIGRFGYSDPDYVGATFLLFAVVTGVAVAGIGVQVAPRGAGWVPMLGVGGGVILAVIILLMNVAGLAGGLSADSGPLAAATVAAALYIGAVGILSLARLRRA